MPHVMSHLTLQLQSWMKKTMFLMSLAVNGLLYDDAVT
jgi:hypothetical protein